MDGMDGMDGWMDVIDGWIDVRCDWSMTSEAVAAVGGVGGWSDRVSR